MCCRASLEQPLMTALMPQMMSKVTDDVCKQMDCTADPRQEVTQALQHMLQARSSAG